MLDDGDEGLTTCGVTIICAAARVSGGVVNGGSVGGYGIITDGHEMEYFF